MNTVKNLNLLPDSLSSLLNTIQILPLRAEEDIKNARELLDKHHYLKSPEKAVGERIYYAVCDSEGHWIGVMLFTAASRRLEHRDRWIGWSDEQRRRRLAFVVNNTRFLILPERSVPNLASAILKRIKQRLSSDWQDRYGHPVLIVETFVDPSQFNGTLYKAANWKELGETKGNRRKARNYYEKHGCPKRLFVCELERNACRNLQAEKLKPSLLEFERKVPIRCTQNSAELKSLSQRFKEKVDDYHKQRCTYPVYSLLGIMAAAHLCDSPRGQMDLEKFAKRLSQKQRQALGIRPMPRKKGETKNYYPAPDQATFSRLMNNVNIDQVEEVLLEWQEDVRGKPSDKDLIAIDGKVPKHSGGKNVVTAVTAKSLHYLGCEVVEEKSNEIPAARKLLGKLDVDGKIVSLDAMHTQVETAITATLECGADYMFTVKDNQPTLCKTVKKHIEEPFFKRK